MKTTHRTIEVLSGTTWDGSPECSYSYPLKSGQVLPDPLNLATLRRLCGDFESIKRAEIVTVTEEREAEEKDGAFIERITRTTTHQDIPPK